MQQIVDGKFVGQLEMFYVVKKITDGITCEAQIVTIRTGEAAEKETADLTEALNLSNTDADVTFVVEAHSNEIKHVGLWQSDRTFMLLGLRQATHRALFQHLYWKINCGTTDVDCLEAAISSLESDTQYCKGLSKDEVRGIIMDELKGGLLLESIEDHQSLSRKEVVAMDEELQRHGLFIKQ